MRAELRTAMEVYISGDQVASMPRFGVVVAGVRRGKGKAVVPGLRPCVTKPPAAAQARPLLGQSAAAAPDPRKCHAGVALQRTPPRCPTRRT